MCQMFGSVSSAASSSGAATAWARASEESGSRNRPNGSRLPRRSRVRQQHQIEIAMQLPVLEAVVQNMYPRRTRRPRGECLCRKPRLVAVFSHKNRSLQRPRQQQRLVAIERPASASALARPAGSTCSTPCELRP